MVVIYYKNSRDMMVEFQDEHKAKVKCQKSTFEKGTVSNPFHPTVYGIGYLGILPELNVSLRDYRPYNIWRMMLRRCYQSEVSKSYKSYEECYVCEEWHCFSNFLKWHNENYYEIKDVEMHLDKDILKKGNKVYSPSTCIYTPQDVNKLFTTQHQKRKYPQGVFYHKKDKVFVYYSHKYRKTIEGCKTSEEAYSCYIKDKQETIVERAEFYKKYIPSELYEALINYKVVA